MGPAPSRAGRLQLILSTTPVLLVLVSVIAYGSGEMLHARLLAWGEALWPGYHTLRKDPQPPACDPTRFVRARRAAPAAAAGGEGDLLDGLVPAEGVADTASGPPKDGAGDDLLAGLVPESGGAAPSAPAGGDDLLEGLVPAGGGPAGTEEGSSAGDDLLEGLVPADDGSAGAEEGAAAEGDDLLAGLVEDGSDGTAPAGGDDRREGASKGPAPTGAGAAAAVELPPDWYARGDWQRGMPAAEVAWTRQCHERHESYRATLGRITPELEVFRTVETWVEGFVALAVAHLRHLLLLLVLVCAATASWTRTHIALRAPRTVLDHRVAAVGQLAANLLLAVSTFTLWRVDRASGVAIEHEELHFLWIGAFVVMAGFEAFHLARPPATARPGGRPVKALACVPLYAVMALVAGGYFLVAERHPAGLAIYLQKLTEHAILYIHVGLYVWIGMLLKQTRLARLGFDVVRPWRLPPELLAAVVVMAAAVPTAYSGASGIFVIAAGAVIYEELRRAGARRQTALAATAMSGSLGVVLSPCLLVVIVASLNRDVTTDQLYHWGVRVFALTALLFLAASLLTRRGRLVIAPPGEAARESLRRLRPLAPYGLLGAGIVAVYAFGLERGVDENSAPFILPVLLLALLVHDRRVARREAAAGAAAEDASTGFRRACRDATTETTGHIGALLLLMGLSMGLGGVVERADVMGMVPDSFGSLPLTMLVLVAVLVIVGMTMDPYGAVILVSASIADIAYRNGIDPVHFWMVVLVAFELGYLTPPVALNHLLARQVVERDDADEEAEAAELQGASFWRRHERILLPMSVMATALLLVAFVPLWWS